jgi:hypothetical protein
MRRPATRTSRMEDEIALYRFWTRALDVVRFTNGKGGG